MDGVWKLTEPELREWLSGLLDAHTVVAPVAEDGVLTCRPITAADQAVLKSSGKTRWSPKEFLFPRSETLYRYKLTGGSIRLEDPPLPDRVRPELSADLSAIVMRAKSVEMP